MRRHHGGGEEMKYRIMIFGSKESGYYAAGSPYKPVLFDRADKVDRKSVDRICSTLRKLGYQIRREKVGKK